MSERRACKAIGFCRMTIRYETRGSDDHDLRERMKALAHERRRFGYRRLHVLLRREGHLVNHKRLFRNPPAQAVCLDLVISSKSMAYVMRYTHFPH